jgi:ketosteroid isomerase-like protein
MESAYLDRSRDTARTMSQENVEVVRRMYEAYHGGDADGALSYFTPDVVSDHSRRAGGNVAHGREELRQQVIEWVSNFEGHHEEIEEIRDLGDLVCVIAIQRGRGRGSGAAVEQRYALLYELKGGKITHFTAFSTPAEAFESAELAE